MQDRSPRITLSQAVQSQREAPHVRHRLAMPDYSVSSLGTGVAPVPQLDCMPVVVNPILTICLAEEEMY
jgi:hypothetical protein